MKLRTACLCLFAASTVALTSCKSNPLGGFTRMGQAFGRSVGIGAENERVRPLRLDTGEIERARAESAVGVGEKVLPEPVSPDGGEHVASAH